MNWANKEDIMVSVCMIAYNHAAYIAEAIEGVMMQETTFPIQLIIGEDCSSDTTRTICLEYQVKYPDKIRLLLPESNLGMMRNFIETLNACTGKYIAMCEGDDYWTDPLKLQKQVDFLEANQEYAGCFHDAALLYQETGEFKLRNGARKIDTRVDLASIIRSNNIPTASMLFQNKIDLSIFDQVQTSKGDYLLAIAVAMIGNWGYIATPMSVYRVHQGGVWSSKGIEYTSKQDMLFYHGLLDYFSHSTTPYILIVLKDKLRLSLFSTSVVFMRERRITRSLLFLYKSLNTESTAKISWKKYIKAILGRK